ncbi:MAG: hypothetical protein DRN14_05250 [Thermoplasmata archaeon]|nr:MAG: hypothetical protein DRN14_05250 [Thermoplasmata archaeon]
MGFLRRKEVEMKRKELLDTINLIAQRRKWRGKFSIGTIQNSGKEELFWKEAGDLIPAGTAIEPEKFDLWLEGFMEGLRFFWNKQRESEW